MVQRQTPLSTLVNVVGHQVPPATLDDVDLRLLSLLAVDSRTSQRGLARSLEMSPPAVGERLARLERVGVIRGYTVDVDWAAVGYPVAVYLAITAAQGSDLGQVIEGLRSVPEVSDITVVTGTIDLLARLVVRDHGHLKELLLEVIWQIEGVQRTETFLALADLQPENFARQLFDAMRSGEEARQA